MSAQPTESRFRLSHKFYKRLFIALLILLLAVVGIVAVYYLTAQSNHLTNPQPVSHTTTLYPTNHTAHIDDNSSTDIIVDISGNSLPDDTYLTITTTKYGTEVPQDAGAPLAVEGATVTGYYDVKVTTNTALSPNVMVKLTLTNPNFNEHSTVYYYNTTQSKWVSVPTTFQSPHTVVGTFAAIALTGTPIAVLNDESPSSSPSVSPTPTLTPSPSPSSSPLAAPTSSPPPFVVPEYSLGIGAMLALIACFAAFALFKTRGKHAGKTAPTPHFKT